MNAGVSIWQKLVWIARSRRFVLAIRMLSLLVRLPRRLQRQPLTGVLSALRVASCLTPRHDTDSVLTLARALVARLPRTRASPCLYRSLLLFRFLPEAGLAPTIHFGVGSDDGALVGHSWISANGKPIADLPDGSQGSYRELYCFASASPASHPSP